MRDFTKYQIDNDGRLPIATGWRIVRASIGWKWVYILEHLHPRAKRVRRSVWDSCNPVEVR